LGRNYVGDKFLATSDNRRGGFVTGALDAEDVGGRHSLKLHLIGKNIAAQLLSY
jgi:hypothetical protein